MTNTQEVNHPSIEDRLFNGEIVKEGSYQLEYNSLYRFKKEDGKLVKFKASPAIFVEQRFQDIGNDVMDMELKFWVQDRFIKKELPMTDLTNLLPIISQYGMPLSKEDATMVQNFLIKQQTSAPLLKIYSTIGFFPIKEEEPIIFGLSKAIGDKHNSLKWYTRKSKFNLRIKGELSRWCDMVENQVIGHHALEFLIGVSCSAVIVGYFNRKGLDNDSLVISQIGEGTSGKTTGAKLAISIFGNPIKSTDDSLYQSWNATENGVIKKLIGNYGVPILVDEFSMCTIQDTTNIIYRFAEGRDRLRGNDKNGLHSVGTWATSIITTGENSIISKSNKNLGAEVRLLEFKNIQWTKDAVHSEAISDVIHHHYGVAGIQFVEYVSQDWNMIDVKVAEWTARLRTTLPESKVKSRLSHKYAVILAALELAGEALNLPFSLKEVEAFIIQNEQQLIVQRDTADMIYREVINDIRAHHMRFIIDDVPEHRGYPCRGKITTPRQSNTSFYRVNYLKNAFDELIEKHQLSNKDTLLNALKKKSYFNHERDRPTMRKAIDGEKKVATYEFHIPKEELDEWILTYQNRVNQ